VALRQAMANFLLYHLKCLYFSKSAIVFLFETSAKMIQSLRVLWPVMVRNCVLAKAERCRN